MSAGEDHSLALTSTGQVLAWGDNTFGELGNGTTTAGDFSVKVKLPKGTKVTAVSAGYDFSLALTSTGQVLAWGSNGGGELGNGTTTGPDTCGVGSAPCSTTPVKARRRSRSSCPRATRPPAWAPGPLPTIAWRWCTTRRSCRRGGHPILVCASDKNGPARFQGHDGPMGLQTPTTSRTVAQPISGSGATSADWLLSVGDGFSSPIDVSGGRPPSPCLGSWSGRMVCDELGRWRSSRQQEAPPRTPA